MLCSQIESKSFESCDEALTEQSPSDSFNQTIKPSTILRLSYYNNADEVANQKYLGIYLCMFPNYLIYDIPVRNLLLI